MWPDIFGLEFPRTFGLVVMLGALGSIWLTSRRAARLGYDKDRVWDFAVALVLAGIIGARIADVTMNWQSYSQTLSGEAVGTGEMILSWFKIWQGNMHFPGGVILAAFVGFTVIRKWGLPIGAWLDLLAPGLALALGATALAHFCQGSYFGLPTEQAWGITFPMDSVPYSSKIVIAEGTALHPLQLYHVLGYVLVSLWLAARLPAARAGTLFCDFLWSAGVVVFICDFWRGDLEPVTWNSYTFQISQFYGLALIVTGIFCKIALGMSAVSTEE